jgi:hypothetical protein
MDTFKKIVEVPSWAHDFCYYYLAVAGIVVLYSLYSLWQLFTLPGIVRKFVPTASMALALILSGAVTTVLAMMQFWICRSALAPARKEGFAVACKSDADCTAVGGVPQGSLCSCGGRGFCGGCVMQNNMEPASMDGGFAPISEGFAVAAPNLRARVGGTGVASSSGMMPMATR